MQEPFTSSDLVICNNKGGKLVGGGFNLTGGMLEGHAILHSGGDKSDEKKGGSAILSGLKGLAVPAGLLYLQKSMQENYYEYENKDTVVDDNLYDKLYKMAADDETSNSSSSKKNKKSKTRRKKKTSKRKGTRRKRS